MYTLEYIKQLIKENPTTLQSFIRKHPRIYRHAKKTNIWNQIKPLLSFKEGKYTISELLQTAKKCNSRFQFQLQYPKHYQVSAYYDILDEACYHMLPVKFSIPQMICKDILDNILDETCIYNDCNIIYPQEIDVYYPSFKLAFEYDGIFHKDQSRPEYEPNKQREIQKNKVCEERGIFLFRIEQTENNRKNYSLIEKEIKDQIINFLPQINKITSKNITPEDVSGHIVNINKFYDMYNLDTIKELSMKYDTIKDFTSNHQGLYGMLQKIKRLDILEHLRGKKRGFFWASRPEEQILQYIKDNFSSSKEAFKCDRIRRMVSRKKLRQKVIDLYG